MTTTTTSTERQAKALQDFIAATRDEIENLANQGRLWTPEHEERVEALHAAIKLWRDVTGI